MPTLDWRRLAKTTTSARYPSPSPGCDEIRLLYDHAYGQNSPTDCDCFHCWLRDTEFTGLRIPLAGEWIEAAWSSTSSLQV
jgi:hypothetical protein